MIPPVHPRDVYDWRGPDDPERAFLEALDRGRLHHAWLLVGPEGVGKATFAYRAARRLLGASYDQNFGLLGSAPDDPVCRLVAARSHPDFAALERIEEDGKRARVISVDQARDLPEFFSKAPSMARFRVAIVDAVDDMNVNAANALLKILEEPPERGVLFLVSHSPGRLLPTIRSRCRRLAFKAWTEADAAAFVQSQAGVGVEEAEALAALARGSPGRALAMAGGPALEYDGLARALVEGEPPSDAELSHVADGFRGKEGGARFDLVFDRLADAVRSRTEAEGLGKGGRVERWADLWDRLSRAPDEADALNLDRGDLFWTAVAELRALRA